MEIKHNKVKNNKTYLILLSQIEESLKIRRTHNCKLVNEVEVIMGEVGTYTGDLCSVTSDN